MKIRTILPIVSSLSAFAVPVLAQDAPAAAGDKVEQAEEPKAAEAPKEAEAPAAKAEATATAAPASPAETESAEETRSETTNTAAPATAASDTTTPEAGGSATTAFAARDAARAQEATEQPEAEVDPLAADALAAVDGDDVAAGAEAGRLLGGEQDVLIRGGVALSGEQATAVRDTKERNLCVALPCALEPEVSVRDVLHPYCREPVRAAFADGKDWRG